MKILSDLIEGIVGIFVVVAILLFVLVLFIVLLFPFWLPAVVVWALLK